VQQVDEAVALLVSQDKNPAFHKVVSGLKAVHPPRNVGGLRIQPINLLKPKQEAAPVQQVAIYLTGTKETSPCVKKKKPNPPSQMSFMNKDCVSVMLSTLSLW